MPTKQVPQPPRGNERNLEARKMAGSQVNHNLTQVEQQRKNKSQYGGGITPIPSKLRQQDVMSQGYEASPINPTYEKPTIRKMDTFDGAKQIPHHQNMNVLEITSMQSLPLSRFDDLSQQLKALDQEEQQINQKRKNIISEKEKITRMIKRIEQREQLAEREEQVRQQRVQLEMDKKVLINEIHELD